MKSLVNVIKLSWTDANIWKFKALKFSRAWNINVNQTHLRARKKRSTQSCVKFVTRKQKQKRNCSYYVPYCNIKLYYKFVQLKIFSQLIPHKTMKGAINFKWKKSARKKAWKKYPLPHAMGQQVALVCGNATCHLRHVHTYEHMWYAHIAKNYTQVAAECNGNRRRGHSLIEQWALTCMRVACYTNMSCMY